MGEADKAEESRARRLAIEKREAESSPGEGGKPRLPSLEVENTCHSCGLAVDENDVACIWCGAGLAWVSASVLAPQPVKTVQADLSAPPVHPSEPIAPPPASSEKRPEASPPLPTLELQEATARPPSSAKAEPLDAVALPARRPAPVAHRPERAPVGLTNGLAKEVLRTGRTNGLARSATGRTSGTTNGLASTIHARRAGMTNGLTNGSGFTNGLGSPRFQRESAASRWKLYVIPVLAGALLLMPLFSPGTTGGGPITIDGVASDWPSAIVHAQSLGGPNPNVDLTRFGIADNVHGLAILIEVAGTALRGGDAPPTMDAFHVFLDADGDPGTGYAVDGLGADRLVRLSGWGGAANVSSITSWDDAHDPTDWRGWRDASVYATTAAAAGRIEAQVDWAIVGETRGAFATVHARGFDGATDRADFALSVAGGSVVFRETPVVPAAVASGTVTLLRLEATAFREAARWSGLTVILTGSSPFNATTELRILDSAGRLVDVRTPMDRRVSFQFEETILAGVTAAFDVVAETNAPGGATLGAIVGSAREVVVGGSAVTLLQGAAAHEVGYFGTAPSDPQVDGGFDEWRATDPDPTGDVTRPHHSDVDVAAFAVQSRGNASYFFTGVAGRLFRGTWVVEPNGQAVPAGTTLDADRDGVPDAVDPLPLDFNNDGIPDASEGGDLDGDGTVDYPFGGTDWWLNVTVPGTFPAPYAGRPLSVYVGPIQRPYHARDDILRVFADIDNASGSGYAVGGLGADRMVELAGMSGAVRSAGVFAFAGAFPGHWSWVQTGDASYAVGYNRTEFASPENLTFAGSRLYVEIAEPMGGRDAHDAGTRGTRGEAATAPSSFDAAPGPTRAPQDVHVETRASTLIDGSSNAITTQYNHQRKVVRAGNAGDGPCTASQSDGCWYAVFYDQVVEAPNTWDRVILRRSTDTSGSLWGTPVVLASGKAADSARVLARDSSEPSIAIDAGGFLHVVWVSASVAGDQSAMNLVRYTRTNIAFPTQAEVDDPARWVTAELPVDDANPGYMPTVSTDMSNNPHLAWSGSRSGGTIFYKNKAAGTWRPTVSWGGTYTGLSVDVSPANNYVSLAAATGTWYGGNWPFRKKITIDDAKVIETVSNFPVLINHTDADLQSKAQSDGDDILFTASDGTTKLSHEVEKYVGGTGELVAFVKVPTVSSTMDTVLYMYYGNPAAASQQDAANVWDANYKGVWHLKEGTGVPNADSTVNGNTGTPTNGPASTIGKMDGALSLDGVNDVIRVNDAASLDMSSAFTLSAWIRPDATINMNSGYNQGLMDKGVFGLFFDKSDGKLHFTASSSAAPAWATSFDGAQEEIHALAVYSGKLYAAQGGGIGDGDVLVYDGASWTTSYNGAQEYMLALAVYDGKLYAGQGSGAGDGDVLVYDGISWTTSYDGAQNGMISFAVYNNKLYAGQENLVSGSGAGDVLVYDGTSWTTSYDGAQEGIRALAVYDGRLYAGQTVDTGDGDVLVFDGTTWSTSYNGLQEFIYSLAVYNGRLYAGQGSGVGDGDVLVFDGTTWSISLDGAQEQIRSLAVYNGRLYAGQGSSVGDGDVFVYDGTSWTTSYDGPRQALVCLAVYNDKLYAGQGYATGDGDVFVFNDGNTVVSIKSSWAIGWHHVAASFDGTTMRLFVAGAQDSSRAGAFTPGTNTFGVLLGTTYGSQMAGGSAEAFDGILDEVRISSIARSAGWVATEHNSQNNPGTFYSVSVVEPAFYGNDGSWPFRKKITIDDAKVATTVTSFPVLISLTDADLQSKAQSDGDDILFTASDGTTKLSHEVEKYVGGTGELVAFVKVPTVSSTMDTVLYMYYGNPAAASQQDAANVWDANYKGVWHLKEGTGVPNADSTVNGNTGTPTNGPTATTGKIDGALNLDGLNDVIRVNDAAPLDMGTAFTLSAWIRPDATINMNAGYNQGLLDKGVFQLHFDKSDGKLHFTTTSTAAPTWTTSYNGAQEEFHGLAVYNGKLYAPQGTNPGDGDVLSYDGASWTLSFDGAAPEIFALATYNGKLYAAQGDTAGSGDIFAYDGTSWTMSYDGAQEEILVLGVYNGKLYAGQGTGAGDGDVLVYDGTSWTVAYDGAQDTILSLAVYDGKLYAGQGSFAGDGDVLVYDGTSWTVAYDGAQEGIYALAVYNDKLYAGQAFDTGDGDVLVYDGTSWAMSHDGAQERINALAVYNGRLYAGQGSSTGDGDVLVYDGISWMIGYDGAQERIIGLAAYDGRLYAGQGHDLGDGDVLVYDNGKSTSSSKSSWVADWHHVVVSFDGTTMRIYVAGALDSSQAITFTPATNALALLMGTTYGSQMKGGSHEAFDGILDEVRISNVARSTDWITTEYNNQNAPATFYAVGGEEGPSEVYYVVCKTLASGQCALAANFTKSDGSAGFDIVASTATVASVQSVTATSFPTDSENHNVQLPATVNAGDLLIAFIAFDGYVDVATPGGWTWVFGWDDCNSPTPSSKFTMYAKEALGTEGGTTVNFVTDVGGAGTSPALEKAAAQVYRVTGWRDTGTVTDDVVYANALNCGSTNASPDPPSLNPANWDLENTLWIAAYGADDDHDVTAYPAGYTDGTYTESDASATSASMGSARRNFPASSDNPGTFTIASPTWWTATTVAVRPAALPVNPRYPSLATSYETNGDLWVAYEKDVHGTSRGIYARALDYPSGAWQAATTVDYVSETTFTRPSIGIDRDDNVHALYVSTSASQVYYNKRTGSSWGTRIAVEHSTSDNPTLMVRAPYDLTYGTDAGGLYWKTSASETYFYRVAAIPEFEALVVPILGILLVAVWRRRRSRETAGRKRTSKGTEPIPTIR